MKRSFSFNPKTVTGIFMAAGSAWILVTDTISAYVNQCTLAAAMTQNIKGILFVLITSAVLYLVLRKSFGNTLASMEETAESNRMLRMLTEINQNLVHTMDDATLLHSTCRIIVDVGGYPFAWIGGIENDKMRIISGAERNAENGSSPYEYPEMENSVEIAGIAARSDRLQFQWIKTGVNGSGNLSCASYIAIPIELDESHPGAIVIYFDIGKNLHAPELELLQEIADDLTYGLSSIRQYRECMLTDRRLVEERNFISTVLDTAAALVLVLDNQGKVVRFNKACERTSGYSEAEVLGNNVFELFFNEDEIECVQKIFNDLRDSGKQSGVGYPFNVVVGWRIKNGAQRLISWSNSIIADEKGAMQYVVASGIDITGKVETEKSLEEANARFRLLSENSQDILYIFKFKPSIGFDYISPALLSVTGYSPEECYADTELAGNMLHPDDRRIVEKYMIGGIPLPKKPVVARFISKSGRIVWMEHRVEGVFSGGNLIAINGIARDITERKYAEEQIHSRMRQQKGLAEVSRMFVSDNVDLDKMLQILGEAVAVNRAYIFSIYSNGTKMNNTYEWCKPGTEPQIQNLQDFDTSITPWWMNKLRKEGVIMIPNIYKMPAEAIVEQEIFMSQEIKAILAVALFSKSGEMVGFMGFDDTEKFREWSDEDAQILRMACEMHSSYSERKEIERALMILSKAIEQSNASIVITDYSGAITYANRKVSELTGYDLLELLGKNPRIFKSGATPPDVYKRLWNSISSGAEWRGVLENKKKNGESFWESILISPIRNEDGKITHFLAVKEDITQKKKTEEMLLQSEKLASIGQLAAGVAHEINNPIGYVYSNIGSLQRYIQNVFTLLREYESVDENQPEEIRKKLDILRDEINYDFLKNDIFDLMKESHEGITRVKQIVRDLKDFSHIADSNWQVYDLHMGINSTLNIVHNEIKYKAVVNKEFGDIPLVQCMPTQINQVLMNIILNAGQAIDKKGEITVRTYAENDGVSVEIQDTGAGMPPENIKKIFDPFFTTKPVGQGTGLGLSLSYSIIKKHRGTISVMTELGKGSTFRIWLPVNQPKEI